MTPSRPRYLSLLAWVVALVSPLLIAPAVAQTDYDSEDNRLIDITTLAQLNAIRYDLDGNGAVANSDTANYNAAFPNPMSNMGCSSMGCNGYELKADLDFDTDDDGDVDANDNPSFPNWNPISTHTNKYTAEFRGNNHTISNLTITTHQGHWRLGLFDTLSPSAVITGVGMVNVNINVPALQVFSHAGALAGYNEGTIRSSYSSGSISAAVPGQFQIGGLVGTVDGGTIAASWSSADVSATGSEVRAGGLMGLLGFSTRGGSVIASYAIGSVTVTGSAGNLVQGGGLVGRILPNSSVTASYAIGRVDVGGTIYSGGLYGQKIGATITISTSYWDTGTSGIDDDADSTEDEGKSTSDLQSPTGYTGIYSGWNVNVDGVAGNDDPWNFGAADQYPVIKFGMDAAAIAAQFAAQPLSQVRGVSVMPGPGALVVSWTAARNAEGYKVQWKSGDEDYDAADRQAVATGTTYTIPNLRADTEYTVRVIATRNAADGPASDEVSETPAPPNVSGVQTTPGEEVLIVSWTAVPGATGYKVQWKSGDEDYDPAERQVLIDDGSVSRVTIPHLAVGKSYTIRVIATFANADELASDEVTGIPRELNTTPIFIDAVDVQRYQQGTEIDPLTLPTPIDGNGTLTYRLTTLPEGLVFDAETLIISGTPLEAMDGATYTLTATDEDGDKGTLQFILVVIADRMSSFGDTTATAPVYVQNRAIDPLTLPQATGGDGTLTYALTPDLPEGLKFDAETLIISGMPLEAMDATTYTLTATDEDDDESLLTFTLEVMADLMPTFGDTTVATQSYTVNREIESLTLPAATSGDGTLAYFLLPFLPDGLSFDPATRTIVGTPLEAMDETTYTLTALDADGDLASLTFALDVQMPSPDFNGDGNVNFADFILFVGKYGSRFGQDRYDAQCDLNADGQIDFADFLIFAASFGATG